LVTVDIRPGVTMFGPYRPAELAGFAITSWPISALFSASSVASARKESNQYASMSWKTDQRMLDPGGGIFFSGSESEWLDLEFGIAYLFTIAL
jgi:hypothetical protein